MTAPTDENMAAFDAAIARTTKKLGAPNPEDVDLCRTFYLAGMRAEREAIMDLIWENRWEPPYEIENRMMQVIRARGP